ncbi:hypothetical protein NW762_006372 [Fusarium torreyae]|uniref:Uncharacterized protein n=1 Tax=Fusarium torreyae TaxID=1237075 RepID=A0A9W8VEB1_9HYPO|nr:hypothetical protein NW762_006372 [Fusarium torreyae]
MVRTKTRPRTKEELYPNSTPKVRLRSKGPPVYNNRTFDDHTGKPVLMSWESHADDDPLPPLASWVFYMVHSDVPHDLDGSEECHAHYLGEMKARGTIWRQIRKVNRAMKLKKQESGEQEDKSGEQKEEGSDREESDREYNKVQKEYEWVHDSASDDDDTTDSQLPGLVWPKHDRDCDFVCYRGWIFMYHDADVDCSGDKARERAISLVRFDPIPLDWAEDEVRKFDPMEHPVCSEPIPTKHKYFDCSLGGWTEMRKRANWEEETHEVFDHALKLGWKSW